MSETHSTSTAPSRRGVLAGGALAAAGVIAGTAAQAVPAEARGGRHP